MKNENKAILENIKNSVSEIEWRDETLKSRATNLLINIFNLYISGGGDFFVFRSLSKQYFIKTMKCAYTDILIIKKKLLESGILETNNISSKVRGIGKGYRFNSKLISGEFRSVLCGTKGRTQNSISVPRYSTSINSSTAVLDSSTNINIQTETPSRGLSLYNSFYLNIPVYHICGTEIKTYIQQGLQRVSFRPEIDIWINNFTLTKDDITIDENIEDEYVEIRFENDKYRYSLEKALKLKDELNKNLIKWKDICYVENVDEFLIRKTNEMRIIFKKSIFEIREGIIRVSRNDTNMRLDYNLTNMKGDLLDYLLLDGEEVVELDICNSQFAILSNILNGLDEDFVEYSKNGTLYEYVSSKLNITPKEAKLKMFRVAFDKVKKDQDDIRELFPKTMEIIDSIKKEEGYKYISNMLQSTESRIIVDCVLNKMIDKGYMVFTIHDAFRVKKSEVDIIKNEIQNIFDEIGFECVLRVKKREDKKTEGKEYEINYKGIETIKTTITSVEKKQFLDFVEQNKSIIHEELVLGTDLFENKEYHKEKMWFMYNKWLEKNPIQYNY